MFGLETKGEGEGDARHNQRFLERATGWVEMAFAEFEFGERSLIITQELSVAHVTWEMPGDMQGVWQVGLMCRSEVSQEGNCAVPCWGVGGCSCVMD